MESKAWSVYPKMTSSKTRWWSAPQTILLNRSQAVPLLSQSHSPLLKNEIHCMIQLVKNSYKYHFLYWRRKLNWSPRNRKKAYVTVKLTITQNQHTVRMVFQKGVKKEHSVVAGTQPFGSWHIFLSQWEKCSRTVIAELCEWSLNSDNKWM